jgi:DNA mismatch repair protein MutL
MKTRQKGAPSGWRLLSDGSGGISVVPWAGAEGTIAEIKNLFFNTPARQKFLKSDSTERFRVVNLLEETALANQEVAFKMLSENKTVFSALKTNNKIDRISDILGRDFSKGIKNIKISHPNISLDVYFTDRNSSLPNRKYQYLFVNSRPVNYPKWLIHCVYQAYRESIPHDRHPGVLVYIAVNPAEIDVNIHPAKREIKFANENSIYDIFFKALRNALASHTCPEISVVPPATPVDGLPACHRNGAEPLLDSVPEKKFTSAGSHSSFYMSECKPDSSYIVSKQAYGIDRYANVFAKQEEISKENFSNEDSIKILGQVFSTYIVVENDNNLYIFDQHAVAERVMYELYLLQVKNSAVKMQQMLIPESFDLPPSGSELLTANIDHFNELGINIGEFGKNSFRITAYPALLGNISIGQIVKTIISDIEFDKNLEVGQMRDKIIRLACHASVKSGDNIVPAEARKLVRDLFKCERPFTCPHGRPTAYKISLKELEKFFRRK